MSEQSTDARVGMLRRQNLLIENHHSGAGETLEYDELSEIAISSDHDASCFRGMSKDAPVARIAGPVGDILPIVTTAIQHGCQSMGEAIIDQQLHW